MVSEPRENGMDNTRSFVPLSKDTMISHYKIIEKIGAGGMGEVWLAEDTELRRKVALKFLSSHLCQDDGYRSRFKREAQAAAVLEHPNIVTVHEVGEYNKRPYIVMQYVEGHSLRDEIKQKELSIDKVIDLTIQVCEGLTKAHEKNIIHRDIKPSNIVIDSDGRPRLLDFGLAAVKETGELTRHGVTLGTIGYMSPEQIRGENLDQRSDLFSLGVVLYEMIAGRPPFKGNTEATTSNSIMNDTPHPLTRYREGTPDSLQTIVGKALDKNAEMRYQTAAGIISDLKKTTKVLESDASTQRNQPSMAVLPFTNMSADPEQEYFCDGMAEEIINALTHVQGLRVVARTSCFAFKGKQQDIREIGRKLNVGTILEGTVRKAGNRLRISAQLINVADGYHLWSERFDREMEDVFAIQDEISLTIVEKLKLKLLGMEKAAIIKRSTEDYEAFNLFLMGRYFSGKKTENALKKSIECFTRAIERDPEFSFAYAGLGYSYLRLGMNDFVPRSDAYRDARVKAMKAIALDDSNSLAHALLAEAMMWGDWDWLGAEREFKRVLTLNPSDAAGHHGYAHLLEILGPLEEHQSGMRALIGYVHAATGKKDEAKKILQRLTSFSQQGTAHHYGQAIIHIQLGEKDRAFEALEKQIESRSARSSMLKVDPILDDLRTDTRFKKLLSKMKLA